MIWLVIILCVLLVVTNIISIYYALRFANIIFIVEDDLSDSMETFDRCQKILEKILGTKLFFDSPDIRPVIMEAMAEIKTGRMAITKVIYRFTKRSKQNYVRVEDVDENEDEE